MKKLLPLFLLSFVAALHPGRSAAQAPASSRTVYMQIFYEGPNWLAGHEVLQYSPAFKGKTGELVAEEEDTRQLSPGSYLQGLVRTTQASSSTTTTTVTTEKGTFITDRTGKTHRQTDEDVRKADQEQTNMINKGFRLLEKRSGLARATLSKALNDAAADGWEVVQMTAAGGSGSLVYLLRKR